MGFRDLLQGSMDFGLGDQNKMANINLLLSLASGASQLYNPQTGASNMGGLSQNLLGFMDSVNRLQQQRTQQRRIDEDRDYRRSRDVKSDEYRDWQKDFSISGRKRDIAEDDESDLIRDENRTMGKENIDATRELVREAYIKARKQPPSSLDKISDEVTLRKLLDAVESKDKKTDWGSPFTDKQGNLFERNSRTGEYRPAQLPKEFQTEEDPNFVQFASAGAAPQTKGKVEEVPPEVMEQLQLKFIDKGMESLTPEELTIYRSGGRIETPGRPEQEVIMEIMPKYERFDKLMSPLWKDLSKQERDMVIEVLSRGVSPDELIGDLWPFLSERLGEDEMLYFMSHGEMP